MHRTVELHSEINKAIKICEVCARDPTNAQCSSCAHVTFCTYPCRLQSLLSAGCKRGVQPCKNNCGNLFASQESPLYFWCKPSNRSPITTYTKRDRNCPATLYVLLPLSSPLGEHVEAYETAGSLGQAVSVLINSALWDRCACKGHASSCSPLETMGNAAAC